MAFARRSLIRKSTAYLPRVFTPRARASAGVAEGMPELGVPPFVGSAAGYSHQAVDDYLGSGAREIALRCVGVGAGGHTIKPKGTVNGNSIRLLLSTGSTASFVHSRLAEELMLKCVPAAHAKVTFGGGKSMTSSTACLDVKWEMGGDSFSSDLRCLDLGDIDIDIILGTDWMLGYGPIAFDFARREVSITSKGKLLVLQE